MHLCTSAPLQALLKVLDVLRASDARGKLFNLSANDGLEARHPQHPRALAPCNPCNFASAPHAGPAEPHQGDQDAQT
jgi:hypothetical protein